MRHRNRGRVFVFRFVCAKRGRASRKPSREEPVSLSIASRRSRRRERTPGDTDCWKSLKNFADGHAWCSPKVGSEFRFERSIGRGRAVGRPDHFSSMSLRFHVDFIDGLSGGRRAVTRTSKLFARRVFFSQPAGSLSLRWPPAGGSVSRSPARARHSRNIPQARRSRDDCRVGGSA